jgi:pimeloyl-ACP methyl ester carboxylesterase
MPISASIASLASLSGVQSLQVNGLEIAYRVLGSDQHPPMLLLHGWGGASRYWLPAMRQFYLQHHCLAPDLPGFGFSPPLGVPRGDKPGFYKKPGLWPRLILEKSYSHQGLAEILFAFLDALKIDAVNLVAHSYGCGIAIAMAAEQPQRVSKLVLSNFSTFKDERERKFVALAHKITGLMVKLRALPFANSDWFAHSIAGRYFHQQPELQVLRDGLSDFNQMDETAANLTVHTSLGWHTFENLAKIQCPTLMIATPQDQIMPSRNAPFTIGRVPNGKLTWIEPCGHLPMVEKTDEFVAVVNDFLS